MRELKTNDVPTVTFILFAAGQHKLKLSLYLLCRGLIQDSLVTEQHETVPPWPVLFCPYIFGDARGNHVQYIVHCRYLFSAIRNSNSAFYEREVELSNIPVCYPFVITYSILRLVHILFQSDFSEKWI